MVIFLGLIIDLRLVILFGDLWLKVGITVALASVRHRRQFGGNDQGAGMNNFIKLAILCSAGALWSTKAPCSQMAASPHELQSAQGSDYLAEKGLVFSAALSALQDEGFSITSADIASGFISAESISTRKTNFWDALESVAASGITRATVVVEGFSPSTTHVRISLISTKSMSGSLGQASREDRPVTSLQAYRELSAKVGAGVNLRLAQITKGANEYIGRSSVVPIAKLGKPVVAASSLQPVQLIAAAKNELLQEGYRLISYDEQTGFLATGPKPTHLTPDIADCGKMFGIPYLRDKRAATDVQIVIEAKPGSISAQAAIDGVYRTGYGNPDKNLVCGSRGELETELLAKIAK